MRIRKVKEKFREDYIINFYQSDRYEVHKKLKRIINNQHYFNSNVVTKKPLRLRLLTRAMALFLLVLVIITAGQYFSNQNQNVRVEEFFALENVEYVSDPVLVTSSYSGEELRIYQVVRNVDGVKETEYYYYFNQVNNNVERLYFVNRDLSISIEINPEVNFGNLSNLINIGLFDDVEVGLIYSTDRVLSKVFTAVSAE